MLIGKILRFMGILVLFFPAALIGDSSMSFETFLCNGTWESKDDLSVKCTDVFSGDGLLKAPSIRLETKKFNFTGTIECAGRCEIIAEEAFDAGMFTQAGGGTFIINGVEQGWKKYWTWLRTPSKARNTVFLCVALAVGVGLGHYFVSKLIGKKVPLRTFSFA